jgi:monofunctional biosynthetic peptidoglycan transglycosylase
LALAALAFGAFVVLGLPAREEVRALVRKTPGKTALMQQREREAKARRRTAGRAQTLVPISRISRWLIQAVIASEDQKFFGHQGVDWNALQESVGKNLEKRRFARGGSTITQQLAKNLYFGTSKSPARKLRELVVTRWLEDDLTKRRILELYLNVIEWGDGIYGADAASRRYYGKPASDLNAQEAAGLAAMIPNPRRINPIVNPARHGRAQRRVLWLMAGAGFLERTAAGLGSEPPPPEPEEEEEEDLPEEEAPTPEEPAAETAPPLPEASPPPTDELATPVPTPVPTPSPTPLPTPNPSPTPPEDSDRIPSCAPRPSASATS